MDYQVGQFVFLDHSGVGIVARLSDGESVREEHIGVWFGTFDEDGAPIICTVPAEYFAAAPNPVIRH